MASVVRFGMCSSSSLKHSLESGMSQKKMQVRFTMLFEQENEHYYKKNLVSSR